MSSSASLSFFFFTDLILKQTTVIVTPRTKRALSSYTKTNFSLKIKRSERNAQNIAIQLIILTNPVAPCWYATVANNADPESKNPATIVYTIAFEGYVEILNSWVMDRKSTSRAKSDKITPESPKKNRIMKGGIGLSLRVEFVIIDIIKAPHSIATMPLKTSLDYLASVREAALFCSFIADQPMVHTPPNAKIIPTISKRSISSLLT